MILTGNHPPYGYWWHGANMEVSFNMHNHQLRRDICAMNQSHVMTINVSSNVYCIWVWSSYNVIVILYNDLNEWDCASIFTVLFTVWQTIRSFVCPYF